jgi:hypothetical protein
MLAIDAAVAQGSLFSFDAAASQALGRTTLQTSEALSQSELALLAYLQSTESEDSSLTWSGVSGELHPNSIDASFARDVSFSTASTDVLGSDLERFSLQRVFE